MAKDEAKPDGWEKLTREGSAEGYPEVGHCKRRHQNYTVRRDGSIHWHGVPEEHTFHEGIPVPKPDAAGVPAQIIGGKEFPSSIPGVLVAEAADVPGTAAEAVAAEKEQGHVDVRS